MNSDVIDLVKLQFPTLQDEALIEEIANTAKLFDVEEEEVK